jgi:cysteine desulfurase
VPFNVEAMHVDLASFTAHKLYGPKGCGALYVRWRSPRVRLAQQIDGGGHERGMRSGTLNVPGIIGFATAVTLAVDEMTEVAGKSHTLRNRLWNGLHSALNDIAVNGPDPEGESGERLPNNLNVSFSGVESEALMMSVRELAVSSGSACTSASLEPSHVLRALGIGEERMRSAIRFGVGRFTTEDEIDRAIALLVPAVEKLRQLSPRRRVQS